MRFYFSGGLWSPCFLLFLLEKTLNPCLVIWLAAGTFSLTGISDESRHLIPWNIIEKHLKYSLRVIRLDSKMICLVYLK